MSFFYWIIIFFAISGLGSLFGGFFRRRQLRSGTSRSGVSANGSAVGKRIQKQFEQFAVEFCNLPDKDVPIKGTKYRVQFTEFPFHSTYSTLRNAPEIDAQTFERISEESLKYSKLTIDYLEATLKNILTGEFGYTEQDAIEILIEFTNQSYILFLDIFVNDALPKMVSGRFSESDLTKNLKLFNDSAASNYRSYFKVRGPWEQFFGWGTSSNDNGGYSQQQVYIDPEQQQLVDAYKMLGVSSTDSDESIKKTYRSLAKKYHPDKNDTTEAKEKMAEINAAYSLIRKKRGF